LHIDELYDLYSSPSIIRMIRSWRMRRTGYAACMGEKKNVYSILVENPEGRRPPERLRRRREIILKLVLDIYCAGIWIGFI
jgi:hypothetical protein